MRRLHAIMHIEWEEYEEALANFNKMYCIAKELGEPSTLALALMGMGTKLGRAGAQQEFEGKMNKSEHHEQFLVCSTHPVQL